MSKWLIVPVVLLILISCNQRPKPIADSRLNDYALYDEKGELHRFSYYNDHKAIVLWVQGNGCPIVRNALQDYHSIVADYEAENIAFFMINSNIQDDRESILKEAEAFDFHTAVLDDSAQLLADALDITITAEAIVLHPVTREILYRGPINDRLDYESQRQQILSTYLRNALDAIIDGREVQSRQDMAKGCKVTRWSTIEKEKTYTYTEDVAPVLRDHCLRCHNDYGMAPWSMTDYTTVLGWSAMIKQVLLSKRMPPWKADPQVGEFENSIILADSNLRKITTWIDQGMAKGNGPDPLLEIDQLSLKPVTMIPDMRITLEREELPATGNIRYRYQTIPLDLTEDRWLKGVTITPENPKVVHHVLITDKARNQFSPITDRKQRRWTDNYIAISAGSQQTTMFPEDTGVFIPAGTELTVQIHYTTTGKPETDQITLDLFFHEDPPVKEFLSLSPSNTEFVIPPFAKDVKHIASDTIKRDIDIYYIVPHMHYRGKSIKFSTIDPDGNKKTLVSVPDYNFNWQFMYKLTEPTFVPKGSVILVEGTFDNSYQNPLNPDPSKELQFGIQSTDEMLIGFFNYTLKD